jgi:hypothetical protein
MLRIRKVLLAIVLIVGLGSLSASLAYGWYLRSDTYRQALEARVSEYLGLPVRIGDVRPLAFGSLASSDVRAYLPGREEPIFQCEQAVWRDRRQNGETRRYLELKRGRLTLGSQTQAWRRPDYQHLLKSSLGHDFSYLKLEYVRLSEMDIEVIRSQSPTRQSRYGDGAWSLRIEGASGQVIFGLEEGLARAHLETSSINGYRVDEAIRIVAEFTPGADLSVREVRLQVPRMPVAELKLDSLLHTAITQGTFAGSVTYREGESYSLVGKLVGVDVSGVAEDLRLDELTAALTDHPLDGRLDRIAIESARFEDGELRHVEFSGRMSGLPLADVVRLCGLALPLAEPLAEPRAEPPIEGCLNLHVRKARVADGRLVYLAATGTVYDVDLSSLTEALGLGVVTGTLTVELHELTIVDDQLVSARIEAIAGASPGHMPTIDRQVVLELARRYLGLELTNLPFEELEYVKLGARIVIDGQDLRVLSPFDDSPQTLLSVRLLGREVPIIRAPARTFHLDDLVAKIYDAARRHDIGRALPDSLRGRWREG